MFLKSQKSYQEIDAKRAPSPDSMRDLKMEVAKGYLYSLAKDEEALSRRLNRLDGSVIKGKCMLSK